MYRGQGGRGGLAGCLWVQSACPDRSGFRFAEPDLSGISQSVLMHWNCLSHSKIYYSCSVY